MGVAAENPKLILVEICKVGCFSSVGEEVFTVGPLLSAVYGYAVLLKILPW